uniref:[histone H3]-lysine(4) N-methyltransferase n=1 Tax=Leptobrachium leishanense TaxID=445787 RepID=A0A8C5QSE0_9ANUR
MAAAASALPTASGSVRGRFPGRPWVGRSGQRADRVRVAFACEGAPEGPDPAQLHILGLHQNMQRLAGACGRDGGDSDSTEEEFKGFNSDDAGRSVRVALRSKKGTNPSPVRALPAAFSPPKQGNPAVPIISPLKQGSPMMSICSPTWQGSPDVPVGSPNKQGSSMVSIASPPTKQGSSVMSIASPTKQGSSVVSIPKHIFIPDKVIRVHLTPLDPTLYGLDKSLFCRVLGEKDISKKTSFPLSYSSATPVKEQSCHNGLSSPPRRQSCPSIPPKSKKRCSGSNKRASATVCQSKTSSMDFLPRVQQLELVSPADVGSSDADPPLKVFPLRKTKTREVKISLQDIAKTSLVEKDPSPILPSTNDLLKATMKSRKAKASDLGSVVEADILVKPNPFLPSFNKGKRVGQVPKIKWKLRAGYRQVSELETGSLEEKPDSKEVLTHMNEEASDPKPPSVQELPGLQLEGKVDSKENLVGDVKESLHPGVVSSKWRKKNGKKLWKKGKNSENEYLKEESCAVSVVTPEEAGTQTEDHPEEACQQAEDHRQEACLLSEDHCDKGRQLTESQQFTEYHRKEGGKLTGDHRKEGRPFTEEALEGGEPAEDHNEESRPFIEVIRKEVGAPTEDHSEENRQSTEEHCMVAHQLTEDYSVQSHNLTEDLSMEVGMGTDHNVHPAPDDKVCRLSGSLLFAGEATESDLLVDPESKESTVNLSMANESDALPDSATAALHRTSRFIGKKKKAQLARSPKGTQEAAQRLLANVEESLRRTEPQEQSSKKIGTRSSAIFKSISELVSPVTRVRSSRVIKTPRRFLDEQASQPAPGPQGKPAALTDNLESGEKNRSGTEQGAVSDALPSVADPCFSLFNEDEHFSLLPPFSPRTESTRTTSTRSSAASSPLQHLPPTDAENKKKTILRAPTFCWNSSSSASEFQPGSRSDKPLFRVASPGTPEELLPPASPASPPPSPVPSQSTPKTESVKRSTLLRAPQFTPSEAHLKIYQSVSLQDSRAQTHSEVPTHAQKLDPILGTASVHKLPMSPTKPNEQPGSRRANHLALPLFVDPSEKVDDHFDSDTALAMADSIPDLLGESEMLREPMGILGYGSESPTDTLLQDDADVPLPPDAIKLEPMDTPGVVCKVAIRRRSTSPTESLTQEASSPATNGPRLSGTDRKVIQLLEKAKQQLIKIDKQKNVDLDATFDSYMDCSPNDSTKTTSPVGQGQDSPLQGPRIKHVCRHPAVALGQPRAMIPEDIPRLSALPLREREATVSSIPPLEESSSASETESSTVKTNLVTSHVKHFPRKAISKGKLRMTRCGECKGCLVTTDCGKCVNCLDKTKFGGPNTKKQCCVNRKCDLIEARRQERLQKKGKKAARAPALLRDSPLESDDTYTEGPEAPEPVQENQSLQRKSSRRCVRQRPCYDLFPDSEDSDFEPSPSATRRKARRESDSVPQEPEEPSKPRKPLLQPMILRARGGPELESSVPGGSSKPKPVDGPHRLRVDFKEDCDLQNVWMMGGLSVLTSFPVKQPLLCLLCASRGRHEFLHCQVCCEPFHTFCLGENERPLPEHERSWCCRRCKFCNVCGRKGKTKKPLLQCELCQTSYHVNCLGPNYPLKPPSSSEGWVCSTCIRCKSCGTSVEGDAKPPEGSSLCAECSVLYEKGNFCPICIRCYEESDFESQMIQCVKCEKWVHARCEGLSDEGYEFLSNLPESVVYTCSPCLDGGGAKWREAMLSEMAAGLHEVLQGIITPEVAGSLLNCTQCSSDGKCPHSPCDLKTVVQLLEDGQYSSVCAFNDDVVWILHNKIKEENDDTDCDDTDKVKCLYIKLMEKCFGWFRVEESLFWDQNDKSFPRGILPNAVLPPSSDHTYAHWQHKHEELPPSTGAPPHPASFIKENAKDANRKSKCEEDNRQCALCLKYGDDEPKDAGRLLYIGQNEWTHINCAIWSAEVFEENDGSLKNVHVAVARARQLRCEYCSKIGATVGCCVSTCASNFHFMCARATRCSFQDDKKMFCQKHRNKTDGKIVPPDSFDVLRRVYVDFEGVTFRRKFLQGLEPENIHMMIGSMTVDCLGMLSDLSVSEGKIYPIGYQCSRLYWSTQDAQRRCWYKCRILEHRPGEGDDVFNGDEDPNENKTIVHSPISLPDTKCEDAAPLLLTPPADTDIYSPPPSLEPVTSAAAPRFFPGARMKTPNFSPSRRPLGGSRPLPSPGSQATSPLAHHILTVSNPESTPLCRSLRPTPTSRVARQSASRLSKDATSPLPSLPSCPLGPLSPPGKEILEQMECGLDDVEMGCEPRQCVGHPGGDWEGGSSSEDDAAKPYYELTRKVVSSESFSHLPSVTFTGHIQQLDGIHDGTDSEDGAQGPSGSVGNGMPPTSLPSDIIDFVLKSTRSRESKAAAEQTLQPVSSSHTATTSVTATSNGNQPATLSNGTDCVAYRASQGPPPLRDPPQLQRACLPQIPIPRSCVNSPAVNVTQADGKLLLINHKPSQMIVNIQSGGHHQPSAGLVALQQELPAHTLAVRAPAPRLIRAACKPPAPRLPLPVPVAAPNLNALYLQATASSPMTPGQTWTLRGPLLSVLPMLNLVQGNFTLGPPALMAPTLAGLPQTCVLQGVAMNNGLLSVTPVPPQPVPMAVPQVHPGLQAIQPAPPKVLPVPPVPAKRSTGAAGFRESPNKKSRTDMAAASTPARVNTSLQNNIMNCHGPRITSDAVALPLRSRQVRVKAPMVPDVLNLDSMKEEHLYNELHVDITVDVKLEGSQGDSQLASPCSEPSEGSLSDFDDFHEEKATPLPRRNEPHLRFEIISEDGFYVRCDSPEAAWKAVMEKVQEARGARRLRHLSFTPGVSGTRMLGIRHNAVLFLLEQLTGAEQCRGYKFLFHPQEVEEEDMPINPSGCARSEYYLRKCTFDMFNFLASQHRTLPEIVPCEEEEDEVLLKSTRRATSLDLPMAMRFRHLKKTSKEAVGVYRSSIHGRGLFCKRNIDVGEMVIEYSGNVIRSVLTDKREKYYDSKLEWKVEVMYSSSSDPRWNVRNSIVVCHHGPFLFIVLQYIQ